MKKWFLCKIRYEKVMEDGTQKRVTEPYLVDALSFTEAEARIIEKTSPSVSGEFTVSGIRRANYSELFSSGEIAADKWYEVRLAFISLDEKSGREKKTYTNMLIQASDTQDAMKKINEKMKVAMVHYQFVSLKETAIMDVYTHNEK